MILLSESYDFTNKVNPILIALCKEINKNLLMRKKILYEIAFYLIIPLIIWDIGRKEIGDYYAMLITTIPGCIYAIWTFIKYKQYNITGIYIISTLVIGRTLDIISGSAEKMLWNTIYINVASIILWITSIIIKKPIGMYFFMDYACLKGYSHETSKALFSQKSLVKHFQYFTAFLIARDLEGAVLKAWSIKKYGVEGFNKIIIFMNINGYIFAGLTIALVLIMGKKIKLAT